MLLEYPQLNFDGLFESSHACRVLLDVWDRLGALEVNRDVLTMYPMTGFDTTFW
jgi:hypothetical protein